VFCVYNVWRKLRSLELGVYVAGFRVYSMVLGLRIEAPGEGIEVYGFSFGFWDSELICRVQGEGLPVTEYGTYCTWATV
jgi:hypothetical protein